MKCLIIYILFLVATQSFGQTSCTVLTSQGGRASVQGDNFYKLITAVKACPQNIDDVNSLLAAHFQNKKYLVANRGRNNPKMGSFSFFESYSNKNRVMDADIFLGHFTHLRNSAGKAVIDLDQGTKSGQLVIELIAWDYQKGFYNFYELIGQGSFNQWFYRGDSKDIILDNQAIYLSQPTQFGQRLRCSGCHTSGGPIMKELAFPHNDWWIQSRPLVFENAHSEGFLKRLQVIDSAENFSIQVQTGMQKLETSPQFQMIKRSLSIPAQLRPLFCDLEINIQSDIFPSEKNGNIQLPSSAFGGPFSGSMPVTLSKGLYQALLQKYALQFPETRFQDADHAWLTPVKGHSDLLAIASLKAAGLVDDKTILDIHFSAQIGTLMNKERCRLLSLVPNIRNWIPGFIQNLKTQNSVVAKSMYQRMTNPNLTPSAYKKAIGEWHAHLSRTLAAGDLEPAFKQLLLNRQAVFDGEISKNPKGQILEPGFRVIFPVKRL